MQGKCHSRLANDLKRDSSSGLISLSFSFVQTETHLRPLTIREVAAAMVLISILAFLEVLLVGGRIVFARPLWMDESLTQVISSAPSIGYMVQALAHGAEWHLPTVYVLM